MAKQQLNNTIRKYHRLLGFFLSGIMVVYACSGVLLIFRKGDFLKFERSLEHHLKPGLKELELGGALRIKKLKVNKETPAQIIFTQGRYNKNTGVAVVTVKDYPLVFRKMVGLHKATTNSPLYFMNIFFGCSLLFFSISSFFMFIPKHPAYRTGLQVAFVGLIMALVLVATS